MAKVIDLFRSTLASGGDITKLNGVSQREAVRALTMLINDPDESIRQNACRRLGELVAQWVPSEIAEFLRRLVWRINPESGDNPGAVPEAIGEIGLHALRQVKPFVPVLAQYLDDDKLLPGLLQAFGQIGRHDSDLVAEYLDVMRSTLHRAEPAVFGNAALALLRLGGTESDKTRVALTADTRKINLFIDGTCQGITLRELAHLPPDRLTGFCFVSRDA